MEQSALFNIVWVFILSYKIAIFSRDKIKTYKLSRKDGVIHMKERGLQIITFTIWFIRRKRVLITVLKNQRRKCLDSSAPEEACLSS